MRLLLVGCGKMGGALLQGWLAAEPTSEFYVVEPGLGTIDDHPRVKSFSAVDEIPSDVVFDIVVIAVKPQVMETVLPDLSSVVSRGSAVISIAAGIRISRFEAAFGTETQVIRVMPNTPAAVGQGVSVLVANSPCGEETKRQASALLKAVGTVEWVEDESLIDPVTAISGGGPAYVFLLIETLAAAGIELGLEPGMAMRLARQTVIGSGALAAASDEEAGQLRRNVTSPKGTTEAALQVLMAKDALQPLITRAMRAASDRGRELGA